MPRFPQAEPNDLEVHDSIQDSTRLAYDFSRIPVYSTALVKPQAKLTVNTPGDAYEQEADSIAQQVMRTSEPQSKRVPSENPEAMPDAQDAVRDSVQGGESLPAEVRNFFAARFGHDFSSVRIHHDSAAAESARALNARAYTLGREVVFGAGEYQPETAAGKLLLAHELSHVLQQSSFSSSAAGSAWPDSAIPRLSQAPAPLIQRAEAPGNAPAAPNLAPMQPLPTRVTASDQYEQYEATQTAIQRFQARAPYFLHNHRPSTGRGLFDAMYYPPYFYITVKVRFNFADSSLDDWKDTKPEPKPADVKWTDEQKEKWRRQFLRDVSAKWTNEKSLLFCVKPGWESLLAQVVVRFVDVDESAPAGLGLEKGDVKAHYDLLITKIPPGEKKPSHAISPGASGREGSANLNSEGLNLRLNEAGYWQRSAVHESGHMLGLGDTYFDPDAPTATVPHGKLAQKELGTVIPIEDDGRLMSRGDAIERSDAVTFLEAIRKATRMTEWSLTPKAPARAPYAPERINDGITPRETVV